MGVCRVTQTPVSMSANTHRQVQEYTQDIAALAAYHRHTGLLGPMRQGSDEPCSERCQLWYRFSDEEFVCEDHVRVHRCGAAGYVFFGSR